MDVSKVSTSPGEMPWAKTATAPKEEASLQPNKAVEWYQPTLKALPSSTVELFMKYVGLKSEDEVRAHIYVIRDKAWTVYVYNTSLSHIQIDVKLPNYFVK